MLHYYNILRSKSENYELIDVSTPYVPVQHQVMSILDYTVRSKRERLQQYVQSV